MNASKAFTNMIALMAVISALLPVLSACRLFEGNKDEGEQAALRVEKCALIELGDPCSDTGRMALLTSQVPVPMTVTLTEWQIQTGENGKVIVHARYLEGWHRIELGCNITVGRHDARIVHKWRVDSCCDPQRSSGSFAQ